MDAETCARLLSVNREFYQSMAESFDATRQRLQPGVLRVLRQLPPAASVLDLGCGNGGVARELARRAHAGPYVGLDFSQPLLQAASERQPAGLSAAFHQADLTQPSWNRVITGRTFDVALAFALLHHLPGTDLRQRILAEVRSHLEPDGRLILSNWQFLNSPRLRKRVQPWESAGLNESDLDPGDYLLDWRRDGYGLRYVHHFSEGELQDLARQSGYRVLKRFYSDGAEGNLGLYQIWAPD